MNKIKLLPVVCLLTLSASFSLFSCRKKDKAVVAVVTPVVVNNFGKLTVKVSNEVDGRPVTFGTFAFTNAVGNNYKIDVLKYYISNFTLIKDDSTLKNLGNYKLIDASNTSTCQFTLDSIANGTYKAIRFYIGVDSSHNHTGQQLGDLDPINGMIWGWKTGYMFFKHEGQFISDGGMATGLLYHFGTDDALSTIDIPISAFEIKTNEKTLYLKFNLNALYINPNPINFNKNNIRQSTSFVDIMWIQQLRANFQNAFTFDKVE